MPGGGDEGGDGPKEEEDKAPSDALFPKEEEEEQLWAQRCKLYLFRAKAKNWVQIGTGKGSLNRTGRGVVSFVFLSEELQLAMARHPLATASSPQRNAGTDKGWSWTARDTIQTPDGTAEQQWFTAKFGSSSAGQSFKDAFDMLKQDPTTAPPTPVNGMPLATEAAQISPISSRMGSPVQGAQVTFYNGGGTRPGEAWLLYFEKGVTKKGSNVRETSTIYIGAFESKQEAIVSAVRAMDLHSDKSQSWRDRSLWDKVYDRRRTVGDKGVVVAVQAADGSFNHVKLRRVPFNVELPATGLAEGDHLWTDSPS